MITRRTLHDENSLIDEQIANLNEQKAANFDAYRAQMADEGKNKAFIRNEVDAFKKAERRLRALEKDADALLEKDALVDEIVSEIQRGTDHATRTRATHEPDDLSIPAALRRPLPASAA